MDAHREAVEAQPGAVEAQNGWWRLTLLLWDHLRAVDLTFELERLILELWKLILGPWRLNPRVMEAHPAAV